MRLSLCNCHFTYFRILSSSRPTVLTQYPLAQKCLPQYRFFNSRCRSKILMAHLPFKKPTVSETENFGGIDNIKCTWSSWMFNSTTSAPSRSVNDRMHFSTSDATGPDRIRYRYLGTHTMWYWQCQIACDSLRKRDIGLLLSLRCGDNRVRSKPSLQLLAKPITSDHALKGVDL